MPSTIEQYREAKNNYLKLRNNAKKELIARFGELAGELYRIQRELLDDFGEKIAIPPRPKKIARPAKSAKAESKQVAAEPAAALSPKLVLLQKQIERTKKKLADAHAANKPAKPIQDRIYELEDELRLEKG